MTERIRKLRKESFESKPVLSAERALIVTEAYRRYEGRVSVPVLRAEAFREICERKAIWIGEGELVVGERGPFPKATSTYPELTCHSLEDLAILGTRAMTSYEVGTDVVDAYRETVIPFWRGRSVREKSFSDMPRAWTALYEAGVFTEFMEQRAPGHTALDGTLYRTGLRGKITEIRNARSVLGAHPGDPRYEELEAMEIACNAAITLAGRHAELAEGMAAAEPVPARKAELLAIAERCRRVPAEAPRTFAEALQAYWFIHLGTVTELNGWDAMSPGHLDQHLAPFYEREIADGTLTREGAKELLSCFWIKVNNTPAPPKVGVTAKESGTYNDFTNINLGGLRSDGSDGSSEVSDIALEVLDELRLLQPQANLQVSLRTPERLVREACRIVRNGSGYPSLFNADEIVLAQAAMGKTLADARGGGTSGCIETGCFGKEAYILHGYLNLPKLLELALSDGIDPATGNRVGPETGDPLAFASFEELYGAFEAQLSHAVEWKTRVSFLLDEVYASRVPAPFLSVWISDCIANALDYYSGGARYNTDYIQCVGLGTVTDSLSALKALVFDSRAVSMAAFAEALERNWEGSGKLRSLARNKVPKFGNDDDAADAIASRLLSSMVKTVGGRKSWRGGEYHIDLLSTTCHVYFGTKVGATPDGRHAASPLSDGTSPSHGADRNGPTAVMNSLSKLDQASTGGTLLNMRFSPETLSGDGGIVRLSSLVRGYFRLGGHHVQFNVVDEKTLRDAQVSPERYRDLLVRVAGYSDYFVDLDRAHQEEIISRTEQREL